MSRLYTLEEVKELCAMAFDDGHVTGYYDDQSKDGNWWVNNNLTNIETINCANTNSEDK